MQDYHVLNLADQLLLGYNITHRGRTEIRIRKYCWFYKGDIYIAGGFLVEVSTFLVDIANRTLQVEEEILKVFVLGCLSSFSDLKIH